MPELTLDYYRRYVVQEPHIVVFEDSGIWYAIDTKTKTILKSSTSKDDVVEYVFNNAPDNSIIAFRSSRPYRYFKPKYVSGGYSLSQLTFKVKKIIRPVVPYDDPYLSIPITDRKFNYSDDSYLLSKITVGASTTLTVGNGIATITGPPSGVGEEYYVYSIDTVPSLLVIVAEVDSWTATLGSTYANPMVVVAKDAGNRLLWLYNTGQRRFETYRVVGGTSYGNEITYSIDMTPPFKLIMVVNYKSAFFFYENNGKITYVGRIADCGFGWNNQSVWRQFKIGFGIYCGANLSVSYRRFKVAYSPIAGLRDPTIVTDKYGAPLIVDGRVFFTITIAGYSEEIPTAGHGLFSVDPGGNLRFEAPISTRRIDVDNNLYGDHASQLIYDPDTGSFIYLVSSWVSQSPVRILLGFTDINLRDRKPLIIDAKQVNLAPDPNSYVYDPFAIFDLSVKKWRIVFANPWNNIYVYENTTMDYTGWTSVANATFTGSAEGCKIVKVNGKLYIGLGKNDESPYLVAVDYPTLANKFTLSADAVVGTSLSPPHPMIVPIPIGTKCKYILLTMDRTLPRGNFIIMEADQLNDGYEFPLLICE
jgi:hypothetical protein